MRQIKVGDHIRLIQMPDDPDPLPAGRFSRSALWKSSLGSLRTWLPGILARRFREGSVSIQAAPSHEKIWRFREAYGVYRPDEKTN